MWDSAIDIRCLLWFLPVYPLRERDSHHSRSSQIQLDGLATQFPGSSCLWFSTVGVTNTPIPINYVGAGNQTRIPMLAEQALKIWAISLSSQSSVFNTWVLFDLFYFAYFYLFDSFILFCFRQGLMQPRLTLQLAGFLNQTWKSWYTIFYL